MKKLMILLTVVAVCGMANAELSLRLQADDFDGTTWTDTSGLGNDATVWTGAPVAGGGVVTFDGDDGLELGTDIMTTSDADGYTIFLLLQNDNTDWSSPLCSAGSGGFHCEFGANQLMYVNRMNQLGLGTNDTPVTGMNLFTMQANDAGGIFRLNGVADGTMNGSSFAAEGIRYIGTLIPAYTTERFIGQIEEIRVYNTQLTINEIVGIEIEMMNIPVLVDVNEFDGVSVVEGGATDTYTVKLLQAPSGANDVIITGVGSEPDEIVITGFPLTFTSTNWNTPQTVTVAAFDDIIDEPDWEDVSIIHDVNTVDPNFAYAPSVIVSVGDDDVLTNGLALRLKAVDFDGTTWADSSGANNHATVQAGNPSLVAGQTANGSSAVTFAVGDYLILTYPIATTGAEAGYTIFAYIRPSSNSWNTIICSQDSGGLHYEVGGPDVYTSSQALVRNNQVLLGPGNTPVSRSFFSSVNVRTNDVESSMRIDGAYDGVVAGSSYDPGLYFIGTHQAEIEQFGGEIAEIRVYNKQLTDAEIETIEADLETAYNPKQNRLIIDTDDGVNIVENGATDTYTVRLGSQPADNVTVTVDEPADPNQTVLGSPLTFTSSDWDTPQPITVTAVDDTDIEADPHSALLLHNLASSDTNFSGYVGGAVEVSVGENDCGTGPFALGDLDENCIVDLRDFAAMAADWLDCSISNCD